MMRRSGIIGTVIIGLLLSVLVMGMPAHAAKKLRIGYLVADQLHSPAVMVMKEHKLLEKAGFEVQWSEFLAGAYVMQEMTSGSLDFVSCGFVPMLISASQGLKLAILASANQEGSSLVALPDIKSAKDLSGKRIGTPGTGSIQDAMVEQLAKTNDIRITRKSMKVSDMPLFLDKKEIDGFLAWAPHSARAISLGYGHELLTSHDIMPDHQCCVFAARSDLLEKDPETFNTVLKIYLQAYKWFLDNQDDAIALMSKNTGMDEVLVRSGMKTVGYPYPPACNTDTMKLMASGLIQSGKIISLKEDQLDSFVNAMYQPQHMEKLLGAK